MASNDFDIDFSEPSDVNTKVQQYSEFISSRESLMEMDECVAGSSNTEQRRGATKRTRSMDREEIWTTVARKGKRFARASHTEDSTRLIEDSIEVSLTCTEKLPKQFKLAKILKEQKIQNVIRVKYVNSYKVLIRLNKEESANELVDCKTFNENGFKCQKTLDVNQSYGVIKNIDLDLTEEEILETLSSECPILAVRRLKRRNSLDGSWEASECLRICFKGSILPLHVYIFDTRVNVDPYIHPVTQCSHCWRYGHIAKMCSSIKPICPKCGNNHTNCETTLFTCNNCGGQHMAMTKICPIFLKEKKIRELMAEHNCSYKKALMLLIPEKTTIQQNLTLAVNKEPEELSAYNESNVKTYVEVTKGSDSRKNIKEKKNIRKKKNKEIINDPAEILENVRVEAVSETSDDESNREENNSENRNSTKEKISWKLLWLKIKDKILATNVSWEEKIKSCVGILWEQALSFIMKHMVDWPCLSFLIKHGQ